MTLKELTVGYRSKRKPKSISENITAELFKGELVCLLGPNGAGKSTLIRTLSGMQKPLLGHVFLQGEDVHKLSKAQLARKMSLVLTDRVQSGLLTAYEVVALGRYPHTGWSGKLSDEDHFKVLEAIKTAGAEDLTFRSMVELSDGERQKIMVAKALVQDPEIMILDEITAFLDLPRRIEIMQLMRRLAKKENKCILMSTHDMELALKYADKLWLQPKNGKLVIGAPEDLILNGSFAKAFESEGIHFDIEKGAFESQEPYLQKVALNGSGNEFLWTKKAMERSQIEVIEKAPVSIEVFSKDDRAFWTFRSQTQKKDIFSIYELLESIKNHA